MDSRDSPRDISLFPIDIMAISSSVITAVIAGSSLREAKSIAVRRYFRAKFIACSTIVHMNICLFI